MKFFRKKKILFKLILTLCICLLLCPFATNNTYVYADNKDDVKEHYKEHLGDDGKVKDYTNSRVEGNAYVYEFADGCKVTVKGTDNQYKSTWDIKMGQSTSQGSYTKDANVAIMNGNSDSTDEKERSPALTAGKLLGPIFDFLMTVGDSIMAILQKSIMGTSSAVTLDVGANLLKFILGVLGAIAAVALLIVVTGGLGSVIGAIAFGIGEAFTAFAGSGLASVLLTTALIGTALEGYSVATKAFSSAFLPDVSVIPTYSISPEEIFEGKLLIFDVNFFHPKTLKVHLSSDTENYSNDKAAKDYDSKTDGKAYYYYYEDNGEKIITSKQNTAMQLSSVISSWYYSIRNFALIMMMLVLIYVGIRMMLSSVASEKSKYKKMLGDWVISMCLVFLLHYIMVFLVSVNEDIVKLVNKATEKEAYAITLTDMSDDGKKFVDAIKDLSDDDLKYALVDANGETIYTGDNDSTEWR